MADDQEEYHVTWIVVSYIVASFNFLASAYGLFCFQALLRNSSARKNAYNIYVMFLILPDGLQSFIVGLWVVLLEYIPQGFYEVCCLMWFFSFLSNFFLNAVVAYEINNLATASHRRQKTSPPKMERAWKQVAVVYLFALAISLWVVLPYNWSLMDIDGRKGSIKFGSPNDGVFGPMVAPLVLFGLISIPITYVLYVRIRIAWWKLLPKRGRTRVLSLFFMRIIIVFLLFYLPNTILSSLLTALDDKPVLLFWISKVSTPLLNACQVYVTLYMVLMKDDVRKIVATAWNDSFGKYCCRMSPTALQRTSAKASGLTTTRPWTVPSNTTNPTSSSAPSLSASNRTESALPKKSEWDEVDFYSERPSDPDISRPESDQEDGYRCDGSERSDVLEVAEQEENRVPVMTTERSHPGQDDEEAKLGNCRDCTGAWAQRQGNSSLDADQDPDQIV